LFCPQNEEDSELPMDSVEMPHFRQRSFLPSQPVRRTPILHNFLHILSSSRSPGPNVGGEQQQRPPSDGASGVGEAPGMSSGPSFPGCTQHLGMVCVCTRCSVSRKRCLPAGASTSTPSDPRVSSETPTLSTASTFSSARTEPRQHTDRPSAFTAVYYSTGASLNPIMPNIIEPLPTPRPGPDWTRSLLNMREGGVGPAMLPPRTSSSSSVSLLSVLRQQGSSSQSPLYTSASEGRGFPQQGESGTRDSAGTSSGHHPFWDGSRSSSASFRNVLQCNLSRYFLEIDRIDIDPSLGGSMADGNQEPSQELLNNNMDPDRPSQSSSSSSASPTIIHYQPPPPPPPASHSLENNVPPLASRGHLNRCRACHNLLTFNQDSQRWERTHQTSSTSSSLEPSSSSSSFPSPAAAWQPEESRRTLEAPTQERGVVLEPSEQPPLPPGGAGRGAGTVAFPLAPPPSQAAEQTVGLVYNQDTAQWERVYRQATTSRTAEQPEALSQEMPVDPPDEDSLRRYTISESKRLLESSLLSLSRYDMSGSRDHPIYPDPARLSPAAYYAQRMIQYLSRRDSIRQRSLRYQQNHRMRTMSTSSDSPTPNPSNSMDNSDMDFDELEKTLPDRVLHKQFKERIGTFPLVFSSDNGDRARHRTPRNARMSAPSLGRFVPRRFLLPEYLPYAGIFHERGQPGLATHSSVNRVLAGKQDYFKPSQLADVYRFITISYSSLNLFSAPSSGASIGEGQSAVASNIANTTYRLQWWDFTKFDLPEISNASVNVLVPNCKIYNDASCDISADGQLLAVFIPSSQRGFPDEGILAIYSLAPHNLGEMLYTKRFGMASSLAPFSADFALLKLFALTGPNAISVSLSPMGCYVMVGLASRRILLHPSTDHMVAQVFRLQQPHGGETSMRMVFNVVYPMAPDQRRHVSINSARWLPDPAMGLAYGTNKGDLVICRPV
ncbi:hypothetical protein GOODEAATRI_014221, partial [Goodea atripinnis]